MTGFNTKHEGQGATRVAAPVPVGQDANPSQPEVKGCKNLGIDQYGESYAYATRRVLVRPSNNEGFMPPKAAPAPAAATVNATSSNTKDDLNILRLSHDIWRGWEKYSGNFVWSPDLVLGKEHRDWVTQWCRDNKPACGLVSLLLLTVTIAQAKEVITHWMTVLHDYDPKQSAAKAGCKEAVMVQIVSNLTVGHQGTRPVVLTKYSEGHDSIEWRELDGTSAAPFRPGRGVVLVNEGDDWHWLPFQSVNDNVWIRPFEPESSPFRGFPHVGTYPPPEGVVWGMQQGGEKFVTRDAVIENMGKKGTSWAGALARRRFQHKSAQYVMQMTDENLHNYGDAPVAWYTPVKYRGTEMMKVPDTHITHSPDGGVTGVAMGSIASIMIDKRLFAVVLEGVETVQDFTYQYARLRPKLDTSVLNPYPLLGCGDRSDLTQALLRGLGYRMWNEVTVHCVPDAVTSTVNSGAEGQRKTMLCLLRAGAPLEHQALYNLAMPTASLETDVHTAQETDHAIRQMAACSRRILANNNGAGKTMEWQVTRQTRDKCCRSCGRPQLAKFKWAKRLCAECTFGYCTVLGYQVRNRLTTPAGYPGVVTLLTINPALKKIATDPAFRKLKPTGWSGVKLT